jgi:hypothetical protein
MKVGSYLVIFFIAATHTASCQTALDTTYVEKYDQKMTIKSYISTNSIEIEKKDRYYRPNNTLNVGLGFSVKNTVIDLEYDFGILELGGKKRGKTKSVDFQVHRYGRHFLLDLFFQKYRGFHEGGKEIELYPDLSIRQIGAEGSYLFNGNKFSAKAAFDQSEKQLRSVGSFILGGGIYFYKIRSAKGLLSLSDHTNNLQLGMNAGYAYSWVLDDHWLLSGMGTAGLNFGNEPDLLKDGRIEVYPTAFARGSAGYHKADWAVYFSTLIQNKMIYPPGGNTIIITPITYQLSYVKHFDSFFKKKR